MYNYFLSPVFNFESIKLIVACNGKFHWPGVSLLWYCLPDRMEPLFGGVSLLWPQQCAWPYSVMFFSNCYRGRTQMMISCLFFSEMLLSISTGFFGLWGSSTLRTRACCITSAELTIKKTQRQLKSENLIISNLKMNFHHALIFATSL